MSDSFGPSAAGHGHGASYAGEPLDGDALDPHAEPELWPNSGGYLPYAAPDPRWDRPPAPPPSPTRRRDPRPWLWSGAAAVVVLAAVLAIVLSSTGPSTSKPAAKTPAAAQPTLSLPGFVDGYEQLQTADVDQVRTELGQVLAQVGGGASAGDHATVGVFAKGQEEGLFFIGVPLSDAPSFRQQAARQGQAAAVHQAAADSTVTLGTRGVASDYPPGPKGGAMSCAETIADSTNADSCVWADEDFLAITLVLDPASNAASATLTRDLRKLTEN